MVLLFPTLLIPNTHQYDPTSDTRCNIPSGSQPGGRCPGRLTPSQRPGPPPKEGDMRTGHRRVRGRPLLLRVQLVRLDQRALREWVPVPVGSMWRVSLAMAMLCEARGIANITPVAEAEVAVVVAVVAAEVASWMSLVLSLDLSHMVSLCHVSSRGWADLPIRNRGTDQHVQRPGHSRHHI